jgi:hypothetical protein
LFLPLILTATAFFFPAPWFSIMLNLTSVVA